MNVSFLHPDLEDFWSAAVANPDQVAHSAEHRRPLAYLKERLLDSAIDHGLVAFVTDRTELPQNARNFPRPSIGALLVDREGVARNLQVRRFDRGSPKTMNMSGVRISGLVFTNAAGLEVLRGRDDTKCVSFAEGLTDFLALASAIPEQPVFGVPGAGNVQSCVGDFVEHRPVLLWFDADEAGEKAVEQAAASATQQGAAAVGRVEWPEGCNDACDYLAGTSMDELRRFALAGQEEGSWTDLT